MAVIATLDTERQRDAERAQHIGSKRSERHHRVIGVERPLGRVEAPVRVGAVQRARVASHHQPAEGTEMARICLRHGQGIGNARGPWPVHGATKYRRKAGLELARSIHIERTMGHAELLRERKLAFERLECALGTVKLEPAFLAQVTRSSGLRQQHLVLGERAREQRAYQVRGLNQALGARSGAKRNEPRRKLRQKAQVIIGFRRTLERYSQ